MNRTSKILLLLLVFLLLFQGIAYADDHNTKPKQIIIVIDRLKLSDITTNTMPNLYKLQSSGSVGLMNTNTSDKREPANTFITIADGRQTLGGIWSGHFYNSQDTVSYYSNTNTEIKSNLTASQLYGSLTGWQSAGGTIINPYIKDVINQNVPLKNNVKVGLLGELLKSNGISSAVIGNSDSNVTRRFAATLVMDEKGIVPSGVVDSSTTEIDYSFPFGVRSNYTNILDNSKRLLKTTDLLVVDLGDLSRLEDYHSIIAESRYTQSRSSSLKNIDNFFKEILPSIDLSKDQLMVLVPTPSDADQKIDNIVTPLIIVGGTYQKDGLLTSVSTRHKGLVSNIDIAPTILNFYNINKDKNWMDGNAATSILNNKSLDYIKSFNNRLVINYQQRGPILIPTASIEIIIIICSLLIIILSQNKKLSLWFQRLTLGFLIVPPAILLFKFIRFPSLLLSLISFVLAIILVVAVIETLNVDSSKKIAFIALFSSIAITIDILTGFNLMINSPLGYDLMVGARYYGLGNEFSGILIGSTLIGGAALLQSVGSNTRSYLRKIPLVLFLMAITVVIFAPNMGADAGGLITSLISFPYLVLMVNDKKINLKKIALLISGALIVLFAGAIIDHVVNSVGQSHIGKAMGQLMQGQWTVVGDLIIRKVSMNLKLMQFSIWSRVLIAVIIGLTILTLYPKGIFKKLENKYQYTFKGIKAAMVASIIGGIFNDSGIVQAATTSIYVIFPLIYLVLNDKIASLKHEQIPDTPATGTLNH